MRFFTADLFIGCSEKLKSLNRPFGSVIEMDNYIVECWNKTVMPHDTVYILGGLGNPNIVKQLNGEKILILGQSDLEEFKRWVSSNNYSEDFELNSECYEEYLRDNFDISRISFSGRVSLKLDDVRIKAASYEKYIDSDDFSVCGGLGNLVKTLGYGVNASIDVNNFRPISDNDLRYYRKRLKELCK